LHDAGGMAPRRDDDSDLERLLREVREARLRFSGLLKRIPDPLTTAGYTFEAETRLFTGIASPRPKGLDANDHAGTTDIRPEDTRDGDYSLALARVLENAGKGWRARRDLNPRPTGSKPGALSN
jgi:hypothetical protein